MACLTSIFTGTVTVGTYLVKKAVLKVAVGSGAAIVKAAAENPAIQKTANKIAEDMGLDVAKDAGTTAIETLADWVEKGSKVLEEP